MSLIRTVTLQAFSLCMSLLNRVISPRPTTFLAKSPNSLVKPPKTVPVDPCSRPEDLSSNKLQNYNHHSKNIAIFPLKSTIFKFDKKHANHQFSPMYGF